MHHPHGLILLSLAAVLSCAAPAAAQQVVTHASRPACEQAGVLTLAECNTAFRNARAEFDEKVPRYRGRRDCERLHGTCTAQLAGDGFAGLSASGAQFVPTFLGIVVSTGADGQKLVVPQSSAKGVRFAARPATSESDRVAGRRAVMGERRQGFGRGGGGRVSAYSNDPQTSGPYVRRGDRDDTIRGPLRKVNPDRTSEPGLFVDENGVEWYRPAKRR